MSGYLELDVHIQIGIKVISDVRHGPRSPHESLPPDLALHSEPADNDFDREGLA